MAEEFDYQRYLASREWALLREAVRTRSGNLCERCRARPHENTHHLTYARIGREELTDLLGVCRLCHAYLSGKASVDPYASEVLARRTLVAAVAQLVDAFVVHARGAETLRDREEWLAGVAEILAFWVWRITPAHLRGARPVSGSFLPYAGPPARDPAGSPGDADPDSELRAWADRIEQEARKLTGQP